MLNTNSLATPSPAPVLTVGGLYVVLSPTYGSGVPAARVINQGYLLRREFSLVDVGRQIAAESHLTEREQQGLMGISMGLSSKEVATQMKTSPNTVKAFLRLIMIKMETASRAGLIVTAMPSPRSG